MSYPKRGLKVRLFSKFKTSSCAKPLLLLLAASSLSGCSVRWEGWDSLNMDPLAFLSSDFGEDEEQAAQDDTLAPPPESALLPQDKIEHMPPLDLSKDGKMGSLGLNLETYFAQEIKDPNMRVERLEKLVKAMHKDMSVMAPELQHLSEAHAGSPPHAVFFYNGEKAAQAGSHEPIELTSMADKNHHDHDAQNTVHNNQTPPPAPAANTPEKKIDQGPRTLPKNGPVISGIRVGEHDDRVRIVFDTTQKTPFNADLDNTEKLLTVEMPKAHWKPPARSERFGKMPVMSSYKVESMGAGEGEIFIVQLKKPTKILKKMAIPALSGGGQRIVIDLQK